MAISRFSLTCSYEIRRHIFYLCLKIIFIPSAYCYDCNEVLLHPHHCSLTATFRPLLGSLAVVLFHLAIIRAPCLHFELRISSPLVCSFGTMCAPLPWYDLLQKNLDLFCLIEFSLPCHIVFRFLTVHHPK